MLKHTCAQRCCEITTSTCHNERFKLRTRAVQWHDLSSDKRLGDSVQDAAKSGESRRNPTRYSRVTQQECVCDVGGTDMRQLHRAVDIFRFQEASHPIQDSRGITVSIEQWGREHHRREQGKAVCTSRTSKPWMRGIGLQAVA